MCIYVYYMIAYAYAPHINTITILLLSSSSVNINSLNNYLKPMYSVTDTLPRAGTTVVEAHVIPAFM